MNWKTGLDYGWWRNPDVWAVVLIGIPSLAVIAFVIGRWWLW